MAPLPRDCPAIHVAFTALADEGLFHWVAVGAEEEEVPCRQVSLQEPGDVAALAYAAARNSRLNVGLAVDRGEIVLHDVHMPERQPVLRFRFDGQAPAICRLMGSNAARMVVRRPFRFPESLAAASPLPKANGPRTTAPAPTLEGNGAPALERESNGAHTRLPGGGAVRVADHPSPPVAEMDLDPRAVASIVAAIVRELGEGGFPS